MDPHLLQSSSSADNAGAWPKHTSALARVGPPGDLRLRLGERRTEEEAVRVNRLSRWSYSGDLRLRPSSSSERKMPPLRSRCEANGGGGSGREASLGGGGRCLRSRPSLEAEEDAFASTRASLVRGRRLSSSGEREDASVPLQVGGEWRRRQRTGGFTWRRRKRPRLRSVLDLLLEAEEDAFAYARAAPARGRRLRSATGERQTEEEAADGRLRLGSPEQLQ